MVLAGVLALMLEVGFRVMEPWPLKIVIDALVSSLKGSGSPGATVPFLLLCGLVLVAVTALRALCNYVATMCFALISSRAAARLRERVFCHVQGLSQQFHARNRSADTVQRIVSDVARLQDVAIQAGLPLLANVSTLAVMLGVMVLLDPVLAVVVVAAVGAFWLTSRGAGARITQASRRTRQGEGRLADTAQESLSSIAVVQSYGLEDLIARRFASANQVSLRQGVRALCLSARLERGTDVIVGLATAAVMVGGGVRVLQGAMSPGDLVLFTTYLRTTMKPLRDMAKYTGRLARAGACGERVADLMGRTPQVTSPAAALVPARLHGHVRLEDVRTEYDGVEVLHGVSLSVSPGEYVAVVGPSGAGKSTLVSLLTRAQDPVGGTVSLDGYPLQALDLGLLRASVSVLHQEALLLTGTVAENIRMGRQDATDAQVEAAARAAGAHGFITDLPQGYDTVVGERGGTLSGGQRQRVGIARALLRSAPVVVLDEATTGLDPHSASLVLDAVDRLVRGRTTIAVTHDAEVAVRATRVVWLEEGRILMDGTPQELAATSPRFRTWLDSRRATSLAGGGVS
ncbi:ABC transporter ATP-binding protein [Actinomyces sp. oral taxon 897]|uniref:ABC transporter ATP-binding protein n=1 Tax=Actinomyces sp. oral taxon 897 TaxID=2081702 RepID=UPI00157F9BD6|nr:ABC transporter ATP-binding protein [Actinomyces sp. oral taxon 897]